MRPWTYETADVPGVPATIKQSPADFVVEELPLFGPSGAGDHLFVTLRKQGLTTEEVVSRIARQLSLDRRGVGVAGLKDKQAIATQTISLPGIAEAALTGLDLPGVELLDAVPHHQKLRRGKLAGNRFTITLRDVAPERAADVAVVRDRLNQRGAPNYFGTQRFGVRLFNHLIGRALLVEDWQAAVGWLAGRPGDRDTDPRVHAARTLFDAGRYAEAADAWPTRFGPERAVTRQLARAPSDPRAALGRLRRPERAFYLSAFQSAVFNQLLEQVIEQRLQTPPFGLIPGYKARANDAVHDDPGLLAAALGGIDPAQTLRRARLKGQRRAFRLRLEITQTWDDALTWRFCLPAGGYATAVLRELIKDDPPLARI